MLNKPINKTLRAVGLRNLCFSALILLATVSTAQAEVNCEDAGQILGEVAKITHKMHVAGNAGQVTRLTRLSTLLLETLYGSKLSALVNQQHDRDLNSNYTAFVHMLEELLVLDRKEDDATIKHIVNTKLDPALPQLIGAFSKSTHCNFQHLNSQLDRIAQMQQVGSSPPVEGKSGGTTISGSESPGSSTNSIGEFFGDPLKSSLFFSLALLSAAALFLIDRRERRKTPRFDLKFDTRIVYSGVPVNVHICNIGHGGAKFRPNPGVVVDDELVISINGKDVTASIRWHSETSVGIAFANHLDDEDLEKLQHALD